MSSILEAGAAAMLAESLYRSWSVAKGMTDPLPWSSVPQSTRASLFEFAQIVVLALTSPNEDALTGLAKEFARHQAIRGKVIGRIPKEIM